MRRFFALLLMLVLLLVGCADNDVDQTGSVPEETVAGYYEDNSLLETQTGGAVWQYDLPDLSYKWMKMAGDRLLLATDSDPVQLHMISGDFGVPAGMTEVNSDIDVCQSLFNGFAYYNQSANAVIFFDTQLNQTQSVSLPEGATSPVISQDGNQIFYNVGNEIRALEVERKLTRLIKTQSVAKQELVATYFQGKILVCNIEDAEGNKDTLYISTENGQTVSNANGLISLYTYEDLYIAERMDGTVRQRIVGSFDSDAKQLIIDDASFVSALELNGVVGYTPDDEGLLLNYYDLSTGKKTASIKIPDISQPQAFLADRWSGSVWILVSDSTDGSTTLLRWNVKASAVQEDKIYVGTLFTAENPDAASMEVLDEQISALNKKYGVRIRIWSEAVKNPGDHVLVPEHQITPISDMLGQIKSVLAEFPKNFVSKSISSKVRICIVRSVDGQSTGTQYWIGKNAYIALPCGCDVRSEFLKAFGSVIDSHVLGNSPKYDYWNTLNPEGFVYGFDLDESLTTGENRAFVNAESMATATADRAHVFWQAMLPDNADTFKSEIMQKKLTMLCKAIRDAWNLEKNTEVYPWEQYLTKSIAYKK